MLKDFKNSIATINEPILVNPGYCLHSCNFCTPELLELSECET